MLLACRTRPPSWPLPRGGPAMAVSGALFWQRAEELLKVLPSEARALVIVRGVHDDEAPDALRTYSLQAYLTGKEFANAIIALSHDTCWLLAGKKACGETLAGIKAELPEGKTANLLTCVPKKDANGAQINGVISDLRALGGAVAVVTDDLKHMRGEFFAGKFLAELGTGDLVDFRPATTQLFRRKDAVEQDTVKKAGAFISTIFNKVALKKLNQLVSDEQKVDESTLAEDIVKAIEDPTAQKVKGLTVGEDDVTLAAIEPIIQSGGRHSLAISGEAASSGNRLEYDCVTAHMSVRFKQYCAFVGRTVLVDPSEAVQAAFDAALKARDALHKALRHGTKFSDAYKAMAGAVPEGLRASLVKEAGFGTGIEWRDAGCVISAGASGAAQEGMVIVTHVGLQKVGGGKKPASIQLIDTVIVPAPGAEEATVVTASARYTEDECVWTTQDDDEDEEEEPAEPATAARPEKELRESTKNFDDSKAGLWHDHQERILLENQENWKMTESREKDIKDLSFGGKLAKGKIKALADNFKVRQSNEILVDEDNFMVYLPILHADGRAYQMPFHGCTFKNTASKVQGEEYTITFDLNSHQDSWTPFHRHFREACWVKQLTYRARTSQKGDLEEKRAAVRRMMTNLKKREQTVKDSEGLVKQADLVKRPAGPIVKLKEVYIKPQVVTGKGSMRCLGDVEAHDNGLRFNSPKYLTKPIDILYDNIKHFLTLPSKHDRFAAIHCVLHNEILLGTGKKTKDIQFWVETETEGEDVCGQRSRLTEQEEDEQERQDKATKSAINKEFLAFAKKLNEAVGIEREIPFAEAWFEGYAGMSDAGLTMLACTKKTVSSVIDTNKFFVASVPEVEVCVFERVVQGRMNFDMAFINKDYTKPVLQIFNIPKKYMGVIKDLCCSVYNIKYYETEANNNWKEVMKEVRKDLQEGTWEPWSAKAVSKRKGGDDDEEDPEEENEEEEEPTRGWEFIFNPDDGSDGSGDGEDDGTSSAYEDSEEDSDSDEEWSGDSADDTSDAKADSDSDASSEANSEDDDDEDSSELEKKVDRKRKGGFGAGPAKRRR